MDLVTITDENFDVVLPLFELHLKLMGEGEYINAAKEYFIQRLKEDRMYCLAICHEGKALAHILFAIQDSYTGRSVLLLQLQTTVPGGRLMRPLLAVAEQVGLLLGANKVCGVVRAPKEVWAKFSADVQDGGTFIFQRIPSAVPILDMPSGFEEALNGRG